MIFFGFFLFFCGRYFLVSDKESCFLVANCIIVSKSYNFFVVFFLFLFLSLFFSFFLFFKALILLI